MGDSRRERADDSLAKYFSDLKMHNTLFEAWKLAFEALSKARMKDQDRDPILIAKHQKSVHEAKQRLLEWEQANGWNSAARIGFEHLEDLVSLASRIPNR